MEYVTTDTPIGKLAIGIIGNTVISVTLCTDDEEYQPSLYTEFICEVIKERKDTKTMENAASSYAKFNRIDLEDEQAVPYDLIVVQPFTAKADPSILGIKPIPNIQEKI